tara:strand:- start:2465 stop:3121 length:657 start_codon:yes stop_codon:yes gene_type:complete
MAENLFETRYDLTKKSKLKELYESNKILIYSLLFVLIVIFSSYTYYKIIKEKKKIQLSENYIQAKIYINNEKEKEAIETLKNIIFSNDPTYSTLSFFMLLNGNLITDTDEISKLFDHLLENNKFDKEIRNLLLYKKALYKSNFSDESKLLIETKELLEDSIDSVWRAHTILLLGDFYFSKKEYTKAKNFYSQILLIKNLEPELYDLAKSKLVFIKDAE